MKLVNFAPDLVHYAIHLCHQSVGYVLSDKLLQSEAVKLAARDSHLRCKAFRFFEEVIGDRDRDPHNVSMTGLAATGKGSSRWYHPRPMNKAKTDLLAQECAKLQPLAEKTEAEERFQGEVEWPPYSGTEAPDMAGNPEQAGRRTREKG